MVRILLAVSLALGMALSAAAQSAKERKELETYCGPDIERLCAGVPVGHGNIMNCLQSKEREMSVGCAEALKKLKDG